MAVEREIKLEVPSQAWDEVLAALGGAGGKPMRLQAVYQDTEDAALARAGAALRVRLEGDRWVQTLKFRDGGAMHRIEDEHVVGSARRSRAAPQADLDLHRAEGLPARLRAALGLGPDEAWPRLRPVFEVRVQRRLLEVSHQGSRIELALDEGAVQAGERSMAVRELEFELLEGRWSDVLRLARAWCERHELWISVASKAQRGWQLARGEASEGAVHAHAPSLPDEPTPQGFASAVLSACLEQVLANAGEVAAGSGGDDHVHQLRVGLRRLRTALRELPVLQPARRSLEPALVTAFRALGERRDRTHVLARIQPLLEAEGVPAVEWPDGFSASGAAATRAVRAPPFQLALFDLLLLAERLRPGGGNRLKRELRQALQRLHRQVLRDGRRFTKLDAARQHRVRKRLKRLRYLSEFAAPLFDEARARDFLAALEPAQDALGDFNDEVIAQHLYEELAQADPAARQGVRRLRERREGGAKASRRVLRALQDARPFWTRRD